MSAECIFKFVEYITKGKYRWVGWFALRRRSSMESPWHFGMCSASSCVTFWQLTIHAFGLVFEVIGPFGVKKNVR